MIIYKIRYFQPNPFLQSLIISPHEVRATQSHSSIMTEEPRVFFFVFFSHPASEGKIKTCRNMSELRVCLFSGVRHISQKRAREREREGERGYEGEERGRGEGPSYRSLSVRKCEL